MARRGTGLIAVLSLVLASLMVIAVAPSAQAAPGDATITATPNTNLNTTQLIQVSGNAGPLSTDNNGSAAGGVPDTEYPNLYISMCRLPLTASSCDTDLGNGIAEQPTNTDPTTAPHVVRVTPDASGNWGPITIMVRKTIVNGDGRFQCGTGANQCVIGSANAPRPADHSYDATADLTFAAPSLTYASSVTNLQSLPVSGSNLQMQTVSTSNPTPTTQAIYTFQCALPLTPSSCNGNPGQYGTATVDKYGSFSSTLVVRQNFTDQGSVARNCAVVSCIIATIKAPPGAPDNFSAYGSTVLSFQASVSISAISGQSVTTHARAGNTISLAGIAFGASLSGGTAELCDVAVTSCSATQLTGAVVASDANGDLVGSSAVVDGSAVTGAGAIRVTLGAKSATVAITILGAPSISATPASAGTGISRAIDGSNWNPGSSVTVSTGGGTGECALVLTADSSGVVSGTCTPTDVATSGLSATANAGAQTASGALAVTGDDCQAQTSTSNDPDGCSLFEDVDLTVIGGDLHLWKSPGRIQMTDVTLNGTPRTSTGALRELRVIDSRGGTAGWSLTGQMSNLTNGDTFGNNVIPAANMTWTPACTLTTSINRPVGERAVGEPSVNTPTPSGQGAVGTGTPGASLGVAQPLCTVAVNEPGGDYVANAALNLDVAAFQNRGVYHGVLTLKLV